MHRINFDSIFLARQRNASLPTGTRDEHDPLPWVDVAPRDLLEAGALCRQGGEGNVLAGGTRRERSGPLWKNPFLSSIAPGRAHEDAPARTTI